MEPRTAEDEVLASVPSTSGAHWANRDNAPRTRHTGERATAFRRSPTLDSSPDSPAAEEDLSPSAYLPDVPPSSWFAEAGRRARDRGPSADLPVRTPGEGLSGDVRVPADSAESSAPEFGPAPPATSGRVSFGVSAGPISPAHRPVSPAAPAHQAASQPDVGTGSRAYEPVDVGSGSRAHAQADVWSGGRAYDPADVGSGGRAYHPADVGSGSRAHVPAGAGSRPLVPDVPETIYQSAGKAHRAAPATEPPRRRSRLMIFATAVLTALVLLGGGLAGVAYFTGDDTTMKQMLSLGAAGADRSVSAPLGGRTTAEFELVAATTKATVRTADLGDDLYRITAPDKSGVRPSPVLTDDRVQLHLTPDGGRTGGTVDVLLSSKVSWALRFTGGADEQVVDLSAGQVSALDVLGGIRRFRLKLPRPIGTVPVRITGAIEDFSIQSPAGNPVRVKVDSGAKTVAAGKVTLKNVKPGSTLTPKDWKVTNRYDVEAAARVTLLSVGNA